MCCTTRSAADAQATHKVAFFFCVRGKTLSPANAAVARTGARLHAPRGCSLAASTLSAAFVVAWAVSPRKANTKKTATRMKTKPTM